MIDTIEELLERRSIGIGQLIPLAAAASFLGSTLVYLITSWACGNSTAPTTVQDQVTIGMADLLWSMTVVPLIETGIFCAVGAVAREAPRPMAILIPALVLAVLHAGHGYPRIFVAFVGFLIQSILYCILRNRGTSFGRTFWTLFSIHALHNATAYGIALAAD